MNRAAGQGQGKISQQISRVDLKLVLFILYSPAMSDHPDLIPHGRSVAACYSLSSPLALSWSHATNSIADLSIVLSDRSPQAPQFIEFDIRHHPLDTAIPVVAHDPIPLSSLAASPPDTFSSWFSHYLSVTSELLKSNPLYRHPGLKLDFKSIESVLPSLAILHSWSEIHDFCSRGLLWFNSDVFPGPNGNPPTIPMQQFISHCQSVFPSAVLSLGWTTRYPGDESVYSEYHVASASALLSSSASDGSVSLSASQVTFPVRAKWFLSSFPQFERLLNLSPHSTLTLWNGRLAEERQLTEKQSIIEFIKSKGLEQRIFLDFVVQSQSES